MNWVALAVRQQYNYETPDPLTKCTAFRFAVSACQFTLKDRGMAQMEMVRTEPLSTRTVAVIRQCDPEFDALRD